ncbi:MAG TPA: hypothetical protein VGI83_03240 [Gemmatimonadales bacterium]|jgi:hypothetical protein
MRPKRRSDAIRNISKDGWKKAEAVEVILSSIVFDVRDLMRQKIPGGDAALVAQFFEETKKVFQLTLSVDPPMDPKLLKARLEELRGLANGPLLRFGERLDKALERLVDKT